MSIGMEIGKLHKVISNVEREYRQTAATVKILEVENFPLGISDHSGFIQTFEQMRNEIVELSTSYKKLQAELQSYAFLSSSSREHRSLIPLAGKVLSGLFGLATTSQVRNLRAGLKSLSENQEMIYHQVESQMSMINVSRKYITENREAINKVIIGVHQIDTKLNNITQMLTSDFSMLPLATKTHTSFGITLMRHKSTQMQMSQRC